MQLYVVDTNILIYALSGQNPWADLVREWIKNKQFALSSIVVAEFLAGAKEDEINIFEALLDKFGSLPIDTAAARLAADYRRKYVKQGNKLKLPDCLIAATCKLYHATLVTANTRDYPMDDITKFKV